MDRELMNPHNEKELHPEFEAVAEVRRVLARHPRWVANTHIDEGREAALGSVVSYIQFGVKIGECCDTSTPTTPAWDHVNHDTLEASGGQCTGCGRYGGGWMTSQLLEFTVGNVKRAEGSLEALPTSADVDRSVLAAEVGPLGDHNHTALQHLATKHDMTVR